MLSGYNLITYKQFFLYIMLIIMSKILIHLRLERDNQIGISLLYFH